MKSKVVIIECNSYEQEQVNAAVKKAVELLGGWNQFVKPDEKIILKPNLLTKCEPEKACTTHPAVFRAAGQLLQEAAVRVQLLILILTHRQSRRSPSLTVHSF